MISIHRRETLRMVSVVSLAAVLAACGSSGRPKTLAAPSAPYPAYHVSIPVPAATPRPVAPPAGLVANVNALSRQFDGRVGIAVRSIDAGWTVEAEWRRPPAATEREQIVGRDDRARFPRFRPPQARRPGDGDARGHHAVPPADRRVDQEMTAIIAPSANCSSVR